MPRYDCAYFGLYAITRQASMYGNTYTPKISIVIGSIQYWQNTEITLKEGHHTTAYQVSQILRNLKIFLSEEQRIVHGKETSFLHYN